LQVPAGGAGTASMRVADQVVDWQKGQCLVFDDSFEHEVTHAASSDCDRIVLLIDFWHPDLNDAEIAALKHHLPAGVEDE